MVRNSQGSTTSSISAGTSNKANGYGTRERERERSEQLQHVHAHAAHNINGLRKNKITHRTRLRIVRGSEAEEAVYLIDEEDERNKVLASQGVDAEDANEHHLQAALNAAASRKLLSESGLSAFNVNKSNDAHIPTPDATGLISNYDELYPPTGAGRIGYGQPTTHVRFSETVEDACVGGLAGGYTYFLDERDAAWLERWNKGARGEGTSASGAGAAIEPTSPVASRRRSKGKGKEPEWGAVPARQGSADAASRTVIDEDTFELVMGLLEKLTDEKFLGLPVDASRFPNFADFAPTFSKPLVPSTWATFIAPPNMPTPSCLLGIARAIYPYWRERKLEREGKRVVPQLDYDESQEENPYICFRRRDPKPSRRTRAASTVYTDKLVRLRTELKVASELAAMVLKREEIKRADAEAMKEVWEKRVELVGNWKGVGSAGAGAEAGGAPGILDEALLFDKERPSKKARMENLGRIVLAPTRRPSNMSAALQQQQPQQAQAVSPGTPQTDTTSPLTAHLDFPGINLNALSPVSYVAVQNIVRDKWLEVQGRAEREVANVKEKDVGWEDVADLPVQNSPEKHFRSCSQLAAGSAISQPQHSMNASPPAMSHLNIPTPSTSRMESEASNESPPSSPPSLTTTFDPPSSSPISTSAAVPPTASTITSPSTRHPFPPAASAPALCRPFSIRLRYGRLGRTYLDRRLPLPQPIAHPLFRAWAYDTEGSRKRRRLEDGEREMLRKVGLGMGESESFGGWGVRTSVYDDEDDEEEAGETLLTELGKRKRGGAGEESYRDGSGDVVMTTGFEDLEFGFSSMEFSKWEKETEQEWYRPPVRKGRGKTKPMSVKERMRRDEERERAWRVEERWRFDEEGEMAAGRGGPNGGRFVLDDWQSKHLRTTISLINSDDMEVLEAEAKYLSPPVIPQSTAAVTPKVVNAPSSSALLQERARIINQRAMRPPQPQPPLLPQTPAIPKLPSATEEEAATSPLSSPLKQQPGCEPSQGQALEEQNTTVVPSSRTPVPVPVPTPTPMPSQMQSQVQQRLQPPAMPVKSTSPIPPAPQPPRTIPSQTQQTQASAPLQQQQPPPANGNGLYQQQQHQARPTTNGYVAGAQQDGGATVRLSAKMRSKQMQAQMQQMAQAQAHVQAQAQAHAQAQAQAQALQSQLQSQVQAQQKGPQQQQHPHQQGVAMGMAVNGAGVAGFSRANGVNGMSGMHAAYGGTANVGLGVGMNAMNHPMAMGNHGHPVNAQQLAALQNAYRQQQHLAAMNEGAMQMGMNMKLPPSRPMTAQQFSQQQQQHHTMHRGSSSPAPALQAASGPHVPGMRVSPVNGNINGHPHGHLMVGRASPHHLAPHHALPGSPHHQPQLPMHPHATPVPARPASRLHQQMVGGAGQGHEYM